MSKKSSQKEVKNNPEQTSILQSKWTFFGVVVTALATIIVAFIARPQVSPAALPTVTPTALNTTAGQPVLFAQTAQTPQFEVPTKVPFAFKSYGFDPPSPSAAQQIKIFGCTTGYGGVGITLRVSVNTASDGSDKGDWKILKELGVPCFNQDDAPVWDTKDWLAGKYQIKIAAKGPDDPDWKQPIIQIVTYELQKP